jgi:hypothetical protein
LKERTKKTFSPCWQRDSFMVWKRLISAQDAGYLVAFSSLSAGRLDIIKSFLLLFFKKEVLP